MRTASQPRTVAVVGAGAAGTLTAIELVRRARSAGEGLRVLLVDDHAHGPGLAYSTGADVHRLNVAAARMSAPCDDPDHFVNWSRARGWRCEPAEFARRSRYGRYLRDLLAESCTRATGEVELVPIQARAVALRGRTLELAGGRPITCDAVVLALGNFPPAAVPNVPQHHRVIEDPWDPVAFGRITRPDQVLLLGTGLTMVDVALTLAERFPDVPLRAVSRTGLVPRGHVPGIRTPAPPAIVPRGPLALDDVVRAVSRALDDAGTRWRSVVDGLRPVTHRIWESLSLGDQHRFLRDHSREWEVRRHRMAPPVAAGVRRLRDTGHLTIERGCVASVESHADGLGIRLADGSGFETSYVVNCTGPAQDLGRVDDPLVHDLLASGAAKRHPLGLGLEVDRRGAVIGSSAVPVMAIGALRRGALYETTAIPEIREQAAQVAEILATGRSAQHTVAA
jgi:uncharacterized NAD(P)/FAD-binding protein YdhS